MSPQTPRPPGPETVLLVDPDQDCRTIFRTILEHAGYRVVEALDGLQALQAIDANHPGVAVMDLQLPRASALHVLAELRSQRRTTPRVVIVTGIVVAELRERAVEGGCADFLLKPCSPRHLLASVRRVMPDAMAAV